jgi:hypothetical protein
MKGKRRLLESHVRKMKERLYFPKKKERKKKEKKKERDTSLIRLLYQSYPSLCM